MTDPHVPSPEFVAGLKRELLRANRAEGMFGPEESGSLASLRMTRRMRRYAIAAAVTFGAILTLSAGLVVGASTGFASVEVLDARKHESELATMATARQLAALRLELAQANYNTVQREVAAGTATRAELRDAKAEVDSMQAYVARVDVDVAASRTTAPPPRPKLAILRNTMPLAALVCRAAGSAVPLPAQTPAVTPQQGVPVIEVSPATARSNATIGTVFGVREVSGGRLLVNDPTRKQVLVFDPGLTAATVAIDSMPGTARSYPVNVGRLAPWLGDSTLFGGFGENQLVLDGSGQIARALAPPQMTDVQGFSFGFPMAEATDSRGRLYARGGTRIMTRPGGGPPVADSTPIYRADLDTRTVDVVARLTPNVGRNRSDPRINGRRVVTSILQPVPTEDAWAVLSDGTVAIVRGQDYHVDWVLPDGTKSSTGKLPFDWKRLTDADKQKMVDSARVVWDSLMAIRNRRVGSADASGTLLPYSGTASDGEGRGGRSGGPGSAPGGDQAYQRMDFVPLSEIPDFYPPVHANAAMGDLDGNLWILPTTSAQSRHGELVYDVVSPKRGLFARVRMPVGRSVVGFGRGGVVYLQAGDRKDGFRIERVTVEVVK